MDPALQELMIGPAEEMVEAIVRFHDINDIPQNLNLVSQYGLIATCRLKRGIIPKIWADKRVASLKAGRLMSFDWKNDQEEISLNRKQYRRRPFTFFTGKGIIVGIADWGFDFTHPNFLNRDGTTRFLALWDQSQAYSKAFPNPYGYGRIYSQKAINLALQSDDPFKTLDYHPRKGDPRRDGAHGTHVLDIAAGNGKIGQKGLAPKADLLAVHLSSGKLSELNSLGDSVRILEAIDFMGNFAKNRPIVINMSVGRQGGPHTGRTLVEQGMDYFLEMKPGRAIVQSTGNYFHTRGHTSARVPPGDTIKLFWMVNKADRTPNELEVWYENIDQLNIKLISPKGKKLSIPRRSKVEIIYQGKIIGRAYHRTKEPNSGFNHLNIFLYPSALNGAWELQLFGSDIKDGRFHAWIERDAACLNCQSQFTPEIADPSYTTGTICNGFRTIAVGAVDPSKKMQLAYFSSAGPTRDGRLKPDILAPGVNIIAAKSNSSISKFSSREKLSQKSGTSMAAPHVSGTIALMFEAAKELLPIKDTRRLLLASTDKVVPTSWLMKQRIGQGLLNSKAAIKAVRDVKTVFPFPLKNVIKK